MNLKHLRQEHTLDSRQIAPFTGEGAYHGSTRKRAARSASAPQPVVVEEMRPTTLDAYPRDGSRPIAEFEATFPNLYTVERLLPVPTQEEVRGDGVTLCWCPLEEALEVAGPLTRRVLEAMKELLIGDKRFVYVDSKIQYFEPGDVPVDSQHWHVDGSIVARGPAVEALGHNLLHDMKARLASGVVPPRYLAYQSSEHCATLFATSPVTMTLPELIPNFDGLDAHIRALSPPIVAQPASSIVRTDGLSLHRAQAASGAGWRLWVRCVETDREVLLDSSIIECYGTVFRPGAVTR
ncbi:hypothetical protein [Pyxidicoccus sp. MSG2]|uniref:hypothetical protein n=1 Tax=Pyxidicoccus sp. MSG2 TaxID=2996790 RepID=UPI0022704EC0|nr:hypothetical protein [Pyxidicoccus sp. MSG2]MCY1022947.1 hypothetical protein [Pyxidicoccus sp. MSG2]